MIYTIKWVLEQEYPHNCFCENKIFPVWNPLFSPFTIIELPVKDDAVGIIAGLIIIVVWGVLYFEFGTGERYLNDDWAPAKLPDNTMNRNNTITDDFIMFIPLLYFIKL